MKFIWARRAARQAARRCCSCIKRAGSGRRAISDDGPAFGTYLHGLFDSDAFTRALLNGLRQRRAGAAGQRPEYARYKTRQFDRLAEAMREHIAIDKIYAIMRQHQEPLC
nr:cobyric acid synthase [Klebsiella pneumoniae]